MAFTQTPMISTEQNKTIPLYYSWTTRNPSNNYDTEAINVLFEATEKDQVTAIKRDGLSAFNLSPAPGNVLAIYFWDVPVSGGFVGLIVVETGRFSAYNLETGARIWTSTAGGSGPGGFTEFLYQNGTVELFFASGSLLTRIQSDGTVTNVPVSVTSQFNSWPVYMDGYLFLSDNKGNIWNSALNDPLTWTNSPIAAESYPDAQYALARVGTYLISFGAESIQYFYDAGNATGTPLGSVQGATKRIGFVGGLAQYGDDIYFIGAATSGIPSLYKMTGLQINKIADFPESRKATAVTNINALFNGYIVNFNGHTLYIWRAFENVANPQKYNNVYAYDVDMQMWTQLAYQSNTAFPIFCSTIGYTLTDGVVSIISMQDTAVVLKVNSDVYQDNGVNFTATFRTKGYDFDTQRAKFGSRLLLHCDQTATTSNMSVSWSDDDYRTYSTPRNIDVSYNYKQLFSLGGFRTRSFKVEYTDNFPMRWRSIELDYSQGTA